MPTLRDAEPERLLLAHAVNADPFTGQASLTVPLRASPGRESLTPALSLVYSNGATNSVFGRGWSLAGLDSIARDPRTHGLPDYLDDTESTYRLASGDRIVPVSPRTTWVVGRHRVTRFRATTERHHRRYEAWQHVTTGRLHWVVREPTGAVSIFGLDADNTTRLADPSSTHHARTFAWLLELAFDPKGNAVRYVYAPEDLDGVSSASLPEHGRPAATAQRYLRRVLYANDRPFHPRHSDLADLADLAGSASRAVASLAVSASRAVASLAVSASRAVASLDFRLELLFDYGQHGPTLTPSYAPITPWPVRPDPFSAFTPGFDLRTYRACRRVLMVHHFPELGSPTIVGQTEIDHNPDPTGLRVTAIRYRGFAPNLPSLTTPDLTLTTTTATPEATFAPASITAQTNLPDGLLGPIEWVDLDNEGIPGFLYRGPHGWHFKSNLGDGEFSPARLVDTLPNAVTALASLDDFDSDGHLDLVSLIGQRPGYYRRDRHTNAWEPFRPLPNQVHVDPTAARLTWADLNGDGYRDLLVERTDRLTWYPSSGPDGFAPAVELARPSVADGGVPAYHPDGRLDTHFADMTGDGLPDIVRIRSGRVEYWPNLGRGHFALPVAMDAAPELAAFGTFDPARIRLADLTGTGTADLLYIGHGELTIWPNACGNRFTAPHTLTDLPDITRPDSLQLLDFRGNGTLSLVWSSDHATHSQRALHTLALHGPTPPGLLTSVDNGAGLRTSLSYRSSAADYLRDKRQGTPWACKLPRHLTVVADITVDDLIGHTRLVTSRTYRDGCYDDHERSFVGFACVDTLEGAPQTPDSTAGLLTRTWTHTGCLPGISPHNTPPTWGNFFALDPPELVNLDRSDRSDTSDSLDNADFFAAHRALIGLPLQQETFALSTDGPAPHPLTVTRSSYQIQLLQPGHAPTHRAPTFAPRLLTSLELVFEGHPTHPRITRRTHLAYDAYQRVTHTLDEAPGTPPPTSSSTPLAVPDPTPGPIAPIDPITTRASWLHIDTPDRYEIGIPIHTQTESPPGHLLRLSRHLYWDDTRTTPLPLGEVGAVVLLHHVAHAVAPDHDDAVAIAHLWAGRVTPALLADAHYDHHDGHWWARDTTFHYNDANHFFRLTAEHSPGGGLRALTFDPHHLYSVETRDAFGNLTRATLDYHHLTPRLIVDANDNAAEALYDALGYPLATTLYGQRLHDERVVPVGGAPLDPTQLDSASDFDTLLAEPTVTSALRRFAHDLHAFARDASPPRLLTLTATAYPHDGEGTPETTSPAAVRVDYLDGLARPLQVKSKLAADRWLASGLVVYDQRGLPIREYEPFHASTPTFEADATLRTHGVAIVRHFDALARPTRLDHPDGTFERHAFTPWQTTSWDRNDNDPGSPHYDTPTITTFDARARPTRLTETATPVPSPSDRITTTRYDALGQVTAVIDPRGLTAFTYTYDMLGRLTAETSIDAGPRVTLHDARDLPTHTWDAREILHHTTYDALARPTTLTTIRDGVSHLAVRTTYIDTNSANSADSAIPNDRLRNLCGRAHDTYDEAGLHRVTDYTLTGEPQRTERQLFTLAPPPENTPPVLEPDTFTSVSTYDPRGLRLTHKAPDGTTRRTTHDLLGLPRTLTVDHADPSIPTTTFVTDADYNARGQLTRLALGNQTDCRHEFDPKSLRLSRLHVAGRTPTSTLHSWMDIRYAYDGNGNITRLDDNAQTPDTPSSLHGSNTANHRAYRYDPFDQLIEATGRVHQALIAADAITRAGTRHLSLDNGDALERYARTYRYDLAGNLLRVRHAGLTREWVHDFTVDPYSNRRWPTPEPNASTRPPPFDPAGNLTTLPHLRALEWDHQGRLTRAVIIERDGAPNDEERYIYGADHQRIRKVTERLLDSQNGRIERIDTLYLDGCELRRITHDDISILERWTSHIHFAERRVALTHRWTQDSLARETDPTDTLAPFKIHYQIGDHLGSTALELDPQGRLITYEEFFPFGGSSFIAGRSKRDIDLKQYRYAGKLRDDTTGLYYFGYRFYAPFIGGWLSPDPIGPEDGLNLYRFVHNNPIRFTDPDGLETVRLEGSWVLPERLQPLLNDPNPQAGRALRDWVESLPRRRGDSIWILDKGRVDFVESPVPLERGAWVYTINEKASEDLLPARPPVYSDNPEANGSPPLDTDEPRLEPRASVDKPPDEAQERSTSTQAPDQSISRTSLPEYNSQQTQSTQQKQANLNPGKVHPPSATPHDTLLPKGENARPYDDMAAYYDALIASGELSLEDATIGDRWQLGDGGKDSDGKGGGGKGGIKGGTGDSPGGHIEGSKRGSPFGTEIPEKPGFFERLFGGIADFFQTVLDVVGMIPGFGEVADLVNGAISLLRGDFAAAAASFAAMVPFLGTIATTAKIADKGTDAAKAASKVGTPNTKMRANANTGSYVHPLTNKVVPTSDILAADHIVPKSWIKAQQGFSELNPVEQSWLLNHPLNTQGLPKSLNSSKGAKMPGDWDTYKGSPLDSDYVKTGSKHARFLRQFFERQIQIRNMDPE